MDAEEHMDVHLQPAGDAERRTVRVSSDATTDDLRAAAAGALGAERGRIRLVFCGRVLPDGASLRAAGVAPDTVVHVSERTAAEVAAASRPPQSSQTAGTENAPPDMAVLHAALQHAGSLLGGLAAGMAFLAPPEPEEARTSAPRPPAPRPPNRGAAGRAEDAPATAASTLAAGPVVRGSTARVLANLDDEMLRLSTLDGSADVVALPPGTPSAADVRLCAEPLARNLAALERLHATVASAAASLRQSLSGNGLPSWASAHLLAGMLVDLPTLSLAERRLLAAVRAHPHTGAPVLPAHVDVPAFLDRARPATDLVEPPE